MADKKKIVITKKLNNVLYEMIPTLTIYELGIMKLSEMLQIILIPLKKFGIM